jgi:hypothetical protein
MNPNFQADVQTGQGHYCQLVAVEEPVKTADNVV